jgi:hypothetical protein
MLRDSRDADVTERACDQRHRKTFCVLVAGVGNVLLMRLVGLVSHRRRRTFMSNGSGVSRGNRNRNARLALLRMLVPPTNAITGIDLADNKQVVVVTDHDSKVLARKTFRCRAWDLGAALDWAGRKASAKGLAGVTVRLRADRSSLAGAGSAGR